jgi:hypothetical protein
MERRHGLPGGGSGKGGWSGRFTSPLLALDISRAGNYIKPMSLKIIPAPNDLNIIRDIAQSGGKLPDMAEAIGCSRRTICTWTIGEEFPEVRAAYMAGKQAYAESLAEDLMEQAQSPLHDDPKLASAEVQRRRLIVDTTKWITGKLLPRVYGDNQRVDHNHSGTVAISPLAQLRQLEHAPVIDVTPSPLPPLLPPTEDDCY